MEAIPGSLPAPFGYTEVIRFSDCDPTAIAYFPRMLEMVNNLIEVWFADGLGMSFDEFHVKQHYDLTALNTRVDFRTACRLGERLSFSLVVEPPGTHSVVAHVVASVAGEERLRLRHRLAVLSADTLQSVALPDALRERMKNFAVPLAAPAPDPVTHPGEVPDGAFRWIQPVRFAHCDPAGIVFYPSFFDMLGTGVEDWFAQALQCPFGADLFDRRKLRMPILSISGEFLKPCRFSETLAFALWPTRLGRSTIEIAMQGSVDGAARVRATQTMCVIDFASFKSTPIPEDLRERMSRSLPDAG